MELAGTVDFDCLDSVEEFLGPRRARSASRAVASLESRVFVPELADAVINSPGEPGIAYHMGVGFPGRGRAPVPRDDARRGGRAGCARWSRA